MTSEFERVWARYSGLLAEGKQAEAQTYIMEEFPKLPQALRDRLLGEMLTIAMEDKVAQRDAMTQLNEEGIAAFEALDEIEKQGGTSTEAVS